MKYYYALKPILLILNITLCSRDGFSQDSAPSPLIDSIIHVKTINHEVIIDNGINYPYNRNRVKTVAISNVALYSVGMVGLYAAWYKDYPQSKFHFLMITLSGCK